jgi:hypothetical protein
VDNWNSPEQLTQLEQNHLANVLAIKLFLNFFLSVYNVDNWNSPEQPLTFFSKKGFLTYNWNNCNSPEQLEQLAQKHLANVFTISHLFLLLFLSAQLEKLEQPEKTGTSGTTTPLFFLSSYHDERLLGVIAIT